MANIVIQGWRFLPHSYSIINQFQCLELLKRPSVQIFHEDVPFFQPTWQSINGLFAQAAEVSLQNIPKPSANQLYDAVLRITYPYNLETSSAPKTCVFGTSEVGGVTSNMLLNNELLKEAHSNSDSIIITPSHWSRLGFINSGADPSRVVIVPHGVEPSIYQPLSTEERNKLRSELGWEGFIFLNIGAMTTTKGIGFLLKAFATIIDKYPEAKLVLKGLDSLYPSKELFVKNVEGLKDFDTEKILQRLIYIGETMPFAQVAQLYQAADAYVSPYFAEGFNMPVLEAIACGLPVICTKGGATDDFTTPDFALHIESKLQQVRLDEHNTGFIVVPELEHLIELMKVVIERQDFITQARTTGPKFVATGFTWQVVVDKLLNVLIPE
ncbi:glycosyltransferase [Iningainema tapete]|uniref:Glycosyltransferase n=1 Tax=Iningainema tapete BLCC-T55 TaxID=2748662 RepID=A0A8J7C4I2_9CYAN|nr:glycosyltransferase [Iningainema tapete]MBD2771524.1 glycosyltransferase [Iningainema tapete BLCC-T55]